MPGRGSPEAFAPPQAGCYHRCVVEEPTVLSLVKVLAPSLTLLVAAGLVATMSARSGLGATWSRAVAALALLLGAVLATIQLDQSASLAGVPLGPVSVSLIELRLSPLTLAWIQLLFLSAAALALVSPPEALPATLALVGISAPALMVGSFPALCLAWFLVEVALAAVGPSPAGAGTWFPLLFGTGAVLAAFHTSASDEALILSLGSLRPVSWLLLVVGVALRLRWWSPAGLASGSVLPAVPFVVAAGTGFFTLAHLESAPRGGAATEWVWAALLLVTVVSALLAWLHRRSSAATGLWSAAALFLPLILLEALSFPPAPWLGPAAAHVLAVTVAVVVLGRMDRPAWLPSWLLTAAATVAALSLLPWPVFPYGGALASTLEALTVTRPAAAVLLALVAGLPAGAMLAFQGPRSGGVARTTDEVSTALAAVVLTLLAGTLVWTLAASAAQSDAALLYSEPSLGALAMAVLSGFIGLALAAADRAGLLAALETGMPAGIDALLPRAVSWVAAQLSAAAVTVFRFLEGETPLTWAVLIGAAVLILAAGQ